MCTHQSIALCTQHPFVLNYLLFEDSRFDKGITKTLQKHHVRHTKYLLNNPFEDSKAK